MRRVHNRLISKECYILLNDLMRVLEDTIVSEAGLWTAFGLLVSVLVGERCLNTPAKESRSQALMAMIQGKSFYAATA